MPNKVIDVTEVQASARGRKPNLDPDLVAFLATVPSGSAARLDGTFGNVVKDRRPTVGSQIRSHWKATGRSEQIAVVFSPEGVPQVKVLA